jgi:hypothetical protein
MFIIYGDRIYFSSLIYLKFDNLIAETDKATLLKFGKAEVWFPKQYIAIDLFRKLIAAPSKMSTEKGVLEFRTEPKNPIQQDALGRALSMLKATGEAQQIDDSTAEAVEKYQRWLKNRK